MAIASNQHNNLYKQKKRNVVGAEDLEGCSSLADHCWHCIRSVVLMDLAFILAKQKQLKRGVNREVRVFLEELLIIGHL